MSRRRGMWLCGAVGVYGLVLSRGLEDTLFASIFVVMALILVVRK